MAIISDRERHIVETEALHLRTIEGLAMAIEAKDQSTHRHLLRVRVYVSEIGRMMGLDDSLMKALMTASFLHDIGKLAVPEHIINKPGKLTHEEFEKMKSTRLWAPIYSNEFVSPTRSCRLSGRIMRHGMGAATRTG